MFDQKAHQQQSRLGTILVNRHYITQSQLEGALTYQQAKNIRLGEALLELGLINQKQLSRALRRQHWLRGVTAGVALVLAPFSPAFASGSSNLGKTSSASSQISVTILPKTLINGDDTVNLSNVKQAKITSPLCTSNLGASLFKLKVTGSGENGALTLSNENDESLGYEVAFQNQGKAFAPLSVTEASQQFENVAIDDYVCQFSKQNLLKVSLLNQGKSSTATNDSRYAGTLTVTIAAE